MYKLYGSSMLFCYEYYVLVENEVEFFFFVFLFEILFLFFVVTKADLMPNDILIQ